MSVCQHERYEVIPSYYSDTSWCPDCGAARGHNGVFGPGSKDLDWVSPRAVVSVERLEILKTELAKARARVEQLESSLENLRRE